MFFPNLFTHRTLHLGKIYSVKKVIKKSLEKSEKLHFFYFLVILNVSHSRALIGQQWIKKEKHVFKKIQRRKNENVKKSRFSTLYHYIAYIDIPSEREQAAEKILEKKRILDAKKEEKRLLEEDYDDEGDDWDDLPEDDEFGTISVYQSEFKIMCLIPSWKLRFCSILLIFDKQISIFNQSFDCWPKICFFDQGLFLTIVLISNP